MARLAESFYRDTRTTSLSVAIAVRMCFLKEAQAFKDSEFTQHERTGRPLGTDRFIEKTERLLNRELKKKKPGPKVDDEDK
jgi:hypothetical protein